MFTTPLSAFYGGGRSEEGQDSDTSSATDALSTNSLLMVLWRHCICSVRRDPRRQKCLDLMSQLANKDTTGRIKKMLADSYNAIDDISAASEEYVATVQDPSILVQVRFGTRTLSRYFKVEKPTYYM